MFPLTVFQLAFWGDFSITDRSFLKLPKKLRLTWSKFHFQTCKNVPK